MHKIEKSTQTVLSSNGSICEAQDDYNDNFISFKKGEILMLSIYGYEVQSLETGWKGVVPMTYIGYSMVELLYLFQFAMTQQKLPIPPILFNNSLLSDDDKAEYFIKKLTNDPTLLQLLRKQISKQKCK